MTDRLNDTPKTYLTILTKNSIFSFLGLVRAEMVDSDGKSKPFTAVVKLDPREGEPVLKEFQTRVEARRNYEDAISTSLDRGWSVVYRGLPLKG